MKVGPQDTAEVLRLIREFHADKEKLHRTTYSFKCEKCESKE
jgi:hypothetical protein